MPGSNEYSMGPEESRTSSTLARKQTAKPSPFYQERDFRQTKLKEMYGDNPTKRQVRKFNRYASSTQGQADELAFVKAESKKYLDSFDAYANSALQKIRDARAAVKPVVVSKPTTVQKAQQQPQAPESPKPVVDNKKSEESVSNSPERSDDFIGPKRVENQGYVNTAWVAPKQEFNLDTFASENNLSHFIKAKGKRFVRFDPNGNGDFYIDEEGNTYKAGLFGTLGAQINPTDTGLGYFQQLGYDELSKLLSKYKQGGPMNKINYFQQGGAAPQQDMQKQIVALVQAAMQGDQKATQTVNKIIEAAKAGDQQAAQLAQMIQQVAQQMQGQAAAAKYGAKLNYIRSLKYAKGGKTCPACAPNKVEIKKCGGKKAKKHQEGGMAELLPGVGTYYSGRRFFNNPSWKGAGEFGLNLAGDLLLLSGVGSGAGAAVKAANYANKASKLVKGASQADKVIDGIRAAGNLAKAQPAMGYASVASKAVKANPAAMTGAAAYMDKAADAYRTASKAPVNGLAGFAGTRAFNGLVNE
jgi:hypothetical protein